MTGKHKVALGLSLLLLSSCRSVQKENVKDQSELNSKKEEIHSKQDEITDKGRALVYGTGYSLARVTNQEPAVKLARNLNSDAQLVLGPPKLEDASTMQKIVDGLLSDLAKEREAAHKLETQFLGTVVVLQREKETLAEGYEAKLKEFQLNASANAVKAQKWDDLQQKNFFRKLFTHLGVWGTLAAVIALMIFFPASIPIIARIVAWFAAKIPKLASAFGVVSVKAFDQVVKGVAEVRNHYKETAKSEELEKVDSSLAKAIDEDHKKLIDYRREVLKVDYARK